MNKYNHYLPKGSLKENARPKKHHGFVVVIFICGFLFPPLAIAVRFGIGYDFFINLVLCLLGYFPSHFHNFYCQNIRNNSNNRRTPKWAIRYGLVDDADMNRKKAKSQWAGRYDERNAHSTLENQDYVEDQIPDTQPDSQTGSGELRRREPALWNDDEIEFYDDGRGAVPDSEAPNKKHWHYPANFEGAVGASKSKKGNSKDRSRATYDDPLPAKSKKGKKSTTAYVDDSDVPEWGRDYGAPRRSRTSTSTRSINSSTNGGPEDVWGSGGGAANRQGASRPTAKQSDPLAHDF